LFRIAEGPFDSDYVDRVGMVYRDMEHAAVDADFEPVIEIIQHRNQAAYIGDAAEKHRRFILSRKDTALFVGGTIFVFEPTCTTLLSYVTAYLQALQSHGVYVSVQPSIDRAVEYATVLRNRIRGKRGLPPVIVGENQKEEPKICEILDEVHTT